MPGHRARDVEDIKYAISKIEEIESPLQPGRTLTAYKTAMMNGRLNIVKYLEPTLPDFIKRHTLDTPIEYDNVEVAKYLIDKYQEEDVVNVTYVSLAVDRGHPELVELLLRDRDLPLPYYRDNWIIRAAERGYSEILEILLQKVNNPYFPRALFAAVEENHLDTVKVLARHVTTRDIEEAMGLTSNEEILDYLRSLKNKA